MGNACSNDERIAEEANFALKTDAKAKKRALKSSYNPGNDDGDLPIEEIATLVDEMNPVSEEAMTAWNDTPEITDREYDETADHVVGGPYEFTLTGDTYTGQWLNGLREGVGAETTTSGEGYKGNFFNDFRSGMGLLVLADGDTYIGEFLAGEFEGEGIYYESSNGYTYQGQFSAGKKDGEGNEKSPDGSIAYTGQYQNDMKNGQGELVINDQTYVGQFVDDAMHGEGVFTFGMSSPYTTYEGSFDNNYKSGVGVLNFKDGSVYTGTFENDDMNGSGSLKTEEGTYNATFLNGERDGEVLFLAAGEGLVMTTQLWAEGVYIKDVEEK